MENERQNQPKKYSLDEYLQLEKVAESRYEYDNGSIVKMAHTSVPHGIIVNNLNLLIGNCLFEKDCFVFAENRMLYIPYCNKSYYPDLLIICGEHKLKRMSENMEATLNPSIVIEVLSDSTEGIDKTDKFVCYRKIPTLKQFILVSQKEKRIEIYNRLENTEKWLLETTEDDDETVQIGDCIFKVKDIYRRINFQDTAEQSSDS